ncbi:HYI isomerase, partial [Polypterus senegalus]
MAPLKFCANISWLFCELPSFTQRLHAAAAAGFRAVEAAWPYDTEVSELQEAKEQAGVEVVLLNTPPGDTKNGDLGLGAVPGRQQEFRDGLDLAVKYAKALNCSRLFKQANSDSTMTVAEFRKKVFDSLLAEYVAVPLAKQGRPSQTAVPDRLTERHFPATYEDKKYKPDCVVCSNR